MVSDNIVDLAIHSPKCHAVVFSNFTSFLNLVEKALDASGFRHVRLDGSMDRKASITQITWQTDTGMSA